MPTAIAIEQITKSFGASGGVPTVGPGGGVNLKIEPGELFFLLGPSGCGKTTLLRIIAGFTEPTSGRIFFGDSANSSQRDVTTLPPNKRNTGMVFQSYALWPHMTVAANVAFGLTIRKVPKQELNTRVREALDLVQMGQFADRKPNQLSGGQQQRVALARALVVRPDVLLLDEPLSNLDAKLRIELRSEIRRICKTARTGSGSGSGGITTVYVTHDQKEALSMADRVAIMKLGQVVQIGSPSDLYHQPKNKFVAEFLGETNFVDGRVVGDAPTTIETVAGSLVSSRPAPSANVVCSLRPEALRLVDGHGHGGSGLRGKLVDTMNLGEIAQHTVEIVGGARLKVAVLNPGPAALSPPGREVTLSAAPMDVVLLSRE